MSPTELHDKENTHFNEGMFYHVFFYLQKSKKFFGYKYTNIKVVHIQL